MNEAVDPETVSVLLNEDARFIFPRGDTFWTKKVAGGHEPELDHFLRCAADRPYVLLDAGANFGYWSILASSAPYGRHAAVAVEASRGNFERLVANAVANNGRFQTVHRALLDVSGKHVSLYGKKHFGLSLRKDWHPEDAERFEDVETITLDEVAERYFAKRDCPVVIKLDVEGVEVDAIKGGRRLLDDGALMIYEDHGKDRTHRVSRFVMALDGFAVWYFSRDDQTANNRAIRITTLDQVEVIKKNPKLGYNFFTYRQPSPWSSLFEGEMGSARRPG
jgi:FkbM family methyltransferase